MPKQINVVTIDRLFPVFLYTLGNAITSTKATDGLIPVADGKYMCEGLKTHNVSSLPSKEEMEIRVYSAMQRRNAGKSLVPSIPVVYISHHHRGLVVSGGIMQPEAGVWGVKIAGDVLSKERKERLAESIAMLRYKVLGKSDVKGYSVALASIATRFIWWLSGLDRDKLYSFDIEHTPIDYELVKKRTQKLFKATATEESWETFKLKLLNKESDIGERHVYDSQFWKSLLAQ